jgi:pimeloyl-ACP methyl ester carboxylesterase
MPFAGPISYTVSGPTENVEQPETILLIMGLAGSGAMWFRLVPHLIRRHRTIVFDNRGTGESAPARSPHTMAVMANDAVAVLDAAGAPGAHMMGASMGGMIAQHVALDHRDRVLSLILACTTAGGRREPPNLRLFAASMLRPIIGPANTFGLVAPALYSPQSRANAPERVRQDMRIRAADRVGALTPAMQMAAIAGHDTRARLKELAGLPTLVLHGLEDRLVPAAHGRELASLIPGADLVEIPAAGHLLATDAEEQVATSVIAHVERARVAATIGE